MLHISSQPDSEVQQTGASNMIAESGYGPGSKMCNAVLEVTNEELHVNKEILMVGSEVFHQMFTSNFSETQSLPYTVKLPTKALEDIIYLLDFLYPNKIFEMTERKAIKLLPLSDEYQIENLKNLCVAELLKQANPSLEIVKMAETYSLTELLDMSIQGCAARVKPCLLEKQQEKHKITEGSMLRIYKIKTKVASRILFEIGDKIREEKRSSQPRGKLARFEKDYPALIFNAITKYEAMFDIAVTCPTDGEPTFDDIKVKDRRKYIE